MRTTYVCEYCNHSIPGASELVDSNASLKAENEKLRNQVVDGISGLKAMMELRQLKNENEKLREALRKIDEPHKYHHWEEDAYTRAGCFQFVAHEARKAIGDLE
jgi:hypothetical protein